MVLKLMEYLPWSFLAYVFMPALLFSLVIRWTAASWSNDHMLPPGPRGLPILGNMLDLRVMAHKRLTDLRHKYGPVVWLRIGAQNAIAILSTNAATDLFKHHDLVFADRRIISRSPTDDRYQKGSVALAPYGSHWRMLKRLMTVDMMSVKRVKETASIRRECIDKMEKWIEEEASKLGDQNRPTSHPGVHLAHFVFLTGFNILGHLVFSRDDLTDPNSKQGLEILEAMKELMQLSGLVSVTDFFSQLRWLDPQGLKKRTEMQLLKVLDIVSRFVKERLKRRQLVGGEQTRDFLDVLLDYEGNENDEAAKIYDVSILILMFNGGTETVSSTIEWAMTELLCNRDILVKAKTELNQVIGQSSRKFEESDVENLPYLQAIIKETLRLHPSVPFLVPRKARQDTQFMGYFIPKDTQVLVNAYAIGRDPEAWMDEPDSFKPERFIGSKIDYKGHHYELIPFGAGRRICAGIQLGDKMLHLVLGSLLHQFDWELGGTVRKETMDWNVDLGITMKKSLPLLAVPKKCFV